MTSNYFKDVMNGKTTLPTKTWKNECVKLTTERKLLDKNYAELKNEAEQIRKKCLQYFAARATKTATQTGAGCGIVASDYLCE